jgi:hypothetical protein
MEKEGVIINEIISIKKKPSTLYQDNRKDTLRSFQALAIVHPNR